MSQDDRELLELAAKAAGIHHIGEHVDGRMYAHTEECEAVLWNPLTDDGDALRLAVKLRLKLHIENYGASARCKDCEIWIGCESHLHGGIESATRRAIVRAAAAIGEQMP